MKQLKEEPGDDEPFARAPAHDTVYCACGKPSRTPAKDPARPANRMRAGTCPGHADATTALAVVAAGPQPLPPAPGPVLEAVRQDVTPAPEPASRSTQVLGWLFTMCCMCAFALIGYPIFAKERPKPSQSASATNP